MLSLEKSMPYSQMERTEQSPAQNQNFTNLDNTLSSFVSSILNNIPTQNIPTNTTYASETKSIPYDPKQDAVAKKVLAFSWLTPQQIELINKINRVEYNETTYTADKFSSQKSCLGIQHPVHEYEITTATTTLGQLSENEIYNIAPFIQNVDLRSPSFKEWPEDKILELIRRCTSLKTLSIQSANITSLPDLPHCEWLNCTYCINLKKIGTIPNCKRLFASGCFELEEHPDLSSCEEINFSDNKKLQKITVSSNCKILEFRCCERVESVTGANNCEIFDGSFSFGLIKVPKELLNCRFFSIRGSQVSELPKIPKAEIVNCSDCNVLRHISTLSSCKTLFCEQSYFLNTVENQPYFQKAYFEKSSKANLKLIKVIGLIHNPSYALTLLDTKISKYNDPSHTLTFQDPDFPRSFYQKEDKKILFEMILERFLLNQRDLTVDKLTSLQLDESKWNLIGSFLAAALLNEFPTRSYFNLEVFQHLLPMLQCSDEEFEHHYLSLRPATSYPIVGTIVNPTETLPLKPLKDVLEAIAIDTSFLHPVIDLAKGIRSFCQKDSKDPLTQRFDFAEISTAEELKQKFEGVV